MLVHVGSLCLQWKWCCIMPYIVCEIFALNMFCNPRSLVAISISLFLLNMPYLAIFLVQEFSLIFCGGKKDLCV